MIHLSKTWYGKNAFKQQKTVFQFQLEFFNALSHTLELYVKHNKPLQ
jgi:hypothetical protein